MRFLTLTVAALGAGLVISGAWATVAERGASADVTAVTVDLGATRQSIDGFGTSNRVWSDPHLANASNASVPPEAQRQILTALYRRLGLTRVRNVLDNGIQPSAGAPMSFAGKRADDHIAFVKQAKGYGLTTFFPGPVYLEDWMKADDPGAYVNWAMTMLQRWRARGLEPALYAPLNEPERGRDFPPQWMHDVVVQLGSRLRAAGFKTKLVVPDDENPVDAYSRAVAVLQDPEARRYVGAIAFHIYRRNSDEDWQRLRRLATQYRLPLWMTEYNSKTLQGLAQLARLGGQDPRSPHRGRGQRDRLHLGILRRLGREQHPPSPRFRRQRLPRLRAHRALLHDGSVLEICQTR